MGEESRRGRVIGRTSTGKPIYDKHNHPDHKNLKSSELECLMFSAYEQSKYHAKEMRKYLLGSPEYECHRVPMLDYYMMYRHVGKLWRSALLREKKKSSTRNR